jgi:hypothetical protein
MSKNAFNYYPTPPEAGLTLLEYLRCQGLDDVAYAIDPAAGSGALPLWLKPLGAKWALYELCSVWRETLEKVKSVEQLTIGDSLQEQWPDGAIFANPPFGSDLVRFMEKIASHCRSKERLGCVLVPAPWWGEGDRAHRWKPDVLLWMTRRMSFDGGKQVPTTHVWSIFLPEPSDGTRVEWAHPVTPSYEQTKAHKAMLKHNPFQMELF